MPVPTYVSQPTPRLVWGQSAVVATVEPVTVNRVRLSTPHRQQDARAFVTAGRVAAALSAARAIARRTCGSAGRRAIQIKPKVYVFSTRTRRSVHFWPAFSSSNASRDAQFAAVVVSARDKVLRTSRALTSVTKAQKSGQCATMLAR